MDAGDPAGRAVLEAALEVKAGRARSLPAEDVPLARFVDRWFRRHIAQGGRWAELARRAHAWSADGPDPATAADLAELAALLDAARVLAVTRRLPSGTGALNQLFHQRAAAELGAAAGGGRRQLAFLPGEPLILRDNDYARDLFNGDTGIALRITRAGGAGELAAVFPQGESFRAFPISALRPRLDRAYAMTVHQAQGSEYDHVALVLPSIDLPLATRELVYTALTRARKSASIAGSPARLRAALARATDRHSGLTAAL
jgi:exodeoxyribonuclease V alpha subunit